MSMSMGMMVMIIGIWARRNNDNNHVARHAVDERAACNERG